MVDQIQYFRIAFVTPNTNYANVVGTLALDVTNGAAWLKVTGIGNTGWKQFLVIDLSALATGKPVQWDGTTLITDKIDLGNPTDDITGTLGIGNGGTAATTAAGARSSLGAAEAANTYTKAQVDTLIAALQALVDALDTRLDTAETEIGAQATDIVNMANDITAIQTELSGMIHP